MDQLQSLDQRFAIVDQAGRPTDYFMRLLKGQGDSIVEATTAVEGAVEGKADASLVLTAGDGLTGGGDLSSNRTFNVGAGTGLTVTADAVAIDTLSEAERIRDIVGTALVAGEGITISVNDVGDTITITGSAGGIWSPVVDGSFPPVFVQNPDGSLVLGEYV
ncbi:hypothetical protein NT2_01_04640 [Caenibius tardaugens NBRC 16725]|uniref:Uncharacterized protein n=1 Tax=Caenibius tardaugens NBRC 16725 TaxID=1219035 RepID=U2Y3U6_9SPHN|nr:hypothetical protein [Caenibius tardaugens]AZI37077.1 hypothetical protein EGO55_14825 [Caenibius tardaugens NBRC 16725]GAD47691.1 hypothetical protein NT2_01_04640 [Caenibius tardaugens NBRC 16725]